jgi:hypothetical protein
MEFKRKKNSKNLRKLIFLLFGATKDIPCRTVKNKNSNLHAWNSQGKKTPKICAKLMQKFNFRNKMKARDCNQTKQFAIHSPHGEHTYLEHITLKSEKHLI